jgi:hypothetical protein
VDAEQTFPEASQRLQISVIRLPVQESSSSEVQRVFAEIAQHRPDGIMVNSTSDLSPTVS